MFFSRTNKPVTIPQPKCEKIIPTYEKQIKNGKVEIVETGKTDIYEKIQVCKEQTLVYNILDRYVQGDVQALNQRQANYGDVTTMPTTLAEAQQKLIDAENYFNSLPLDVRGKFDHSFNLFLDAAGKGKLGDYHESFKPVKVEETTVQAPVTQPAQVETVVQTPTIVTGGTNE